VSSLLVDGEGRIVAGTTTAGVFVSGDGGETWIAANLGLPTRGIRGLAIAVDGDLYAAAGPEDWELDPVKDRNAGRRGIYKGRFAGPR
jgi:hypothetical protein